MRKKEKKKINEVSRHAFMAAINPKINVSICNKARKDEKQIH